MLKQKMTFQISSLLKLLCLIWVSSSSSAAVMNIGVVDDFDSSNGKEERIAVEIAVREFYGNASFQPVRHFKNYGISPIQAFPLANVLVKENHVKVLMGFQTWEAAAVTVDFSNKSQIPILSLAEEVPPWASQEWPFLINAARSQRAQMKAVTAMVQSCKWWRVAIIYEDTGSVSDGSIPDFINDIQNVGVVIDELARIYQWPAFSRKNYLHRKLDRLKVKQTRVFIVHASVRLASRIFIQAKKLGMMEKGSVWITTSKITNELDSLNATTISSMQGVLGVKSYYPISGNKFKSFRAKFRVLFKSLYPNEPFREPGLSALQAYDAVWALVRATDPISNSSTVSGKSIVDKISNSTFEGLNGEFRLGKRGLKAQKVFRIVNVFGKSYRELGYWSDGLGFSVSINKGSKYDKSLSILGQVFWPGGLQSLPRGFIIPTKANPIIIGVPANPAFDDFVKVVCDDSSCKDPKVTGFSVDVFNATVAYLPYYLYYTFQVYHGNYDDMIRQVQNQTFQAVIGDTSILANRSQYAQFTQPYSDSGLQGVIYLENHKTDNSWLFTTPFATELWIFTLLINIYNGFVVWLIERRHNSAFRGSIWNQIGTLVNSSVNTLLSLNGERLHSNMSRITMMVWLFLALVITQSYTANLTTLLTAQKLNTPVLNIDELLRTKEKVGCDRNSFVGGYLRKLGFSEENVVQVDSADEYPQLLKNGGIKAAFLITPYVKIFLAKYCNGYATSGPTFKVGGFGFAFARGHPLLPDISEAVLKVSENGNLTYLESKMLGKYKCTKIQPEQAGLGISSFKGLFLISSITSTIALISFCVSHLHQNWQGNFCRVASELQVAEAGNHDPQEDETNMFAFEIETYHGQPQG